MRRPTPLFCSQVGGQCCFHFSVPRLIGIAFRFGLFAFLMVLWQHSFLFNLTPQMPQEFPLLFLDTPSVTNFIFFTPRRFEFTFFWTPQRVFRFQILFNPPSGLLPDWRSRRSLPMSPSALFSFNATEASTCGSKASSRSRVQDGVTASKIPPNNKPPDHRIGPHSRPPRAHYSDLFL